MTTIPDFDFRTHFNPAEAAAMRNAFDAVWGRLQPDLPADENARAKMKQEVAEIIVALATAGERDEQQLVAGCLAQYPPRPSPAP
ncbi:MAG: hypothetical protein JWL93_2237 [Hyphomicrobiales bacterium]|nr:hypothetical protein [Hyphomicrobiales bacterium]